MASFERVNYSLRPNKCIERKMISEVLSRLSFIDSLHNYRYIGFGSPYFVDFSLFHKSLGIQDLISIEKEEDQKPRFEFNKPFSCIHMEYGESTTVLPNLELDKKRNIIWLDYDDSIKDTMFSDIDTVIANAMPGSVLLMSVNVDIYNKTDELLESDLIKRLGKSRVPAEFISKINATNYVNVIYTMIKMQVTKSLLERNGGDDSKLDYQQVFNFIYKDGITMLTIGGIIYDSKQKQAIQKMKLNELKYFRDSEKTYKIKCPNLTYKEIHALNNFLPCDINLDRNSKITNAGLKDIPINAKDVQNYSEIYRYFPHYAETIV